jgi:hypothetical protein
MSDSRSSGLLRVPFVRRCFITFDGAPAAESAFLVNINVLGTYIAWDPRPPQLGLALRLRFGMAGTEREVSPRGVVAWINLRQQHPVHSLPPGFGVRFLDLQPEARRAIEDIVDDYVRRQPPGR